MSQIKFPDDDALLGQTDGVKLYVLDIYEPSPLYRNFKLIGDAVIHGTRRVAYLTWVCHEGRLVRGGDAWRVLQARPKLIKWALGVIGNQFGKEYVMSTFGLDESEYAALVAADKVNRNGSKTGKGDA